MHPKPLESNGRPLKCPWEKPKAGLEENTPSMLLYSTRSFVSSLQRPFKRARLKALNCSLSFGSYPMRRLGWASTGRWCLVKRRNHWALTSRHPMSYRWHLLYHHHRLGHLLTLSRLLQYARAVRILHPLTERQHPAADEFQVKTLHLAHRSLQTHSVARSLRIQEE